MLLANPANLIMNVNQVVILWQGDFQTTASFPSLSTKYLLIPDPNIVRFTRTLKAGEDALFRKEARKKIEYTVSKKSSQTS